MNTPGTIFAAGSIRLTIYGLFIALGLLAGYMLASRRAKQSRIRDSIFQKAYFSMLITGAVVARILYVSIEFRATYNSTLGLTLRFWEGGYSVFGAIVGGVLGIRLATGPRGFRRALDMFMPALTLTLAIWRLGELASWQGRGTILGGSFWFFPYSIPNSQGMACLAICVYEAVFALIITCLGMRPRNGRPAGSAGYTCFMLICLAQVTFESMRTDDFLEISFVKIDQLLAMIAAMSVLAVFMRGSLRAGSGYVRALVPMAIAAGMVGMCVSEEFKIDGSPNPMLNFLMLGIYTTVITCCGLYLRTGWSAMLQNAASATKKAPQLHSALTHNGRTAPSYFPGNEPTHTQSAARPSNARQASTAAYRSRNESTVPRRAAHGDVTDRPHYSRGVDSYRSANTSGGKQARQR